MTVVSLNLQAKRLYASEGCEFAKHAAHVTGLDLTLTMIEEAGKRQQEQNLTDVSWHIGDVLPLPFPNAHFSCVVTRYSFYHFLDPMAVCWNWFGFASQMGE